MRKTRKVFGRGGRGVCFSANKKRSGMEFRCTHEKVVDSCECRWVVKEQEEEGGGKATNKGNNGDSLSKHHSSILNTNYN